MFNKISACNSINNPSFKSDLKEESKSDTAVSEERAPDKIEYIKLSATLLAGALIASGGIALALKALKNRGGISYCDIKKCDVSEELYNFLMHQKKEETNFTRTLDRDLAIKLNGLLTEDNFSDFKKLSRTGFLSAGEVADITEKLNEHNSPFIDTIIEKRADNLGFHLNDGDFSKIIGAINETNKDYAQKLINSARLYEKNNSLVDILNFINKDNKEAFDAIISSRIPYENLDGHLSFGQIKQLTELVQKQKNPKSAKFLLSLQASDSPSKKIGSFDEIKKILEDADDKYAEYYAKYFGRQTSEIEKFLPVLNDKNAFLMPHIDDRLSVSTIESNNYLEIMQLVNDDNAKLAEELAKKTRKVADDNINIDPNGASWLLRILKDAGSDKEKIAQISDYYAKHPNTPLCDYTKSFNVDWDDIYSQLS